MTESNESPRGKWLRWLLWSVAAFPCAVLSHEAAHYLAYRVFGFPGAALHYGSASYDASDAFWERMRAGDLAAASALVDPWQVGIGAAAGLIATYLTIAGCIWAARRWRHPFWVGLGLISPLRFLGSVFVLGAALLGRRGENGSDEAHVAQALHLPEMALHLLGVAVLVAAWVVLLRVPARELRRGRLAVLAGIVLGGVLYIGVLGPLLLP